MAGKPGKATGEGLRALPLLQTTGFPFTGRLINLQNIGSFVPVLNVTINTTDTVIRHDLGRAPSGYLVIAIYSTTAPYFIKVGSNMKSDWTGTNFVLRAGSTTVVDLLVF